MKDKVSLIVPIFNVERYLAKCLDSLINQTYKNLEIILINDGSTDNSLSIAEKYAMIDARIIIVNKINEGLSIARQTGIDMCQGTYFSTIDSDDYLDNCFVELMLNSLTAHKGDIALCAKNIFDDTGYCEKVNLEKGTEPILVITSGKLEKNYSKMCGTYQMSDSWNKMYRTEFVKKSKVRFELGRQYNGTDLMFNHMLLLHQPVIVTINEPLYNYRLTPNSRVRRKDKHLEKGFKEIFENLLMESIHTINTNAIRNQIYSVYMEMLKYATLDAYEEHRYESKECILNGFREIIQSMPHFSLKQRIGALKCVPSNIKIFTILLLSNNALGMYAFYKLRDRLE